MKFAIGVICCALAWASVAEAHEIGKTQVRAVVDADNTYQVDVVVDPDALLTRLEILETGTVSAPMSRDERDRRIATLMPTFARAVRLNFDGVAASPEFAYRPVSAFSDLAAAPSAVRLTGRAPSGARRPSDTRPETCRRRGPASARAARRKVAIAAHQAVPN